MIFAVYTCIKDQHDLRLVVLAGLICYVSTTIGFDMLERARRRGQTAFQRSLWLPEGQRANGSGDRSCRPRLHRPCLPRSPGYDMALTGAYIPFDVAGGELVIDCLHGSSESI